MAANGLNAVRTYTLPPRWLLDTALEHGLWVMVGLAWEQHVDFLASRARARSIEDRVRSGVAACAGHPAVLCYAVGNEIPTRVVRWAGRGPVERFVERLHAAGRQEDPGGLFTYVNYPSTEYLQSPASDLVAYNVYLESPAQLEAYLARVQNLAGDRPLLMAELGLDSRAHGTGRQAETLDWQVRTAFASGCAGAFVFSWTDEWHVSYLSEHGHGNGSVEMRDWDFGLTDREREPKPALTAVRKAFGDTPFEADRALAARIRRRLHLQRRTNPRTLPRGARLRRLSRFRGDRGRRRVDRRQRSHRGSSRLLAHLDREPRPRERAQHRHAGSERRDRRLPGRRCTSRSPLVALSRGDHGGRGLRWCRRAESPAPGRRTRRTLRRRSPGRADPRAAVGSRGRAPTGLQHGVPARRARAPGRLRPAVPGRRRRRRHLLAPDGSRTPAGLQPRSRRVALAAAVRACLPATAAGLWGRRGAAGAQVAGPLRSARTCPLEGAAVRARPALGTRPATASTSVPGVRSPSRHCTVPGPPGCPGSGRCPSGISRWRPLRRWRSPGFGGRPWRPLLPLLAAALIAWVVPAALGARRAGFRYERMTRRRRFAMSALTTLLYLIQPLARLRGRMRTPSWRPANAPAPMLPRRRSIRALERDLARARGSPRRDRAHRPPGRRGRLRRRILGLLGPPFARWPAGRGAPAHGRRGARRRTPARAHPGHAACFAACDRDRGDARRGCARRSALGGVAERPGAGGGLARGGRPARMGVRRCDRLARARRGPASRGNRQPPGSPLVAERA